MLVNVLVVLDLMLLTMVVSMVLVDRHFEKLEEQEKAARKARQEEIRKLMEG
jgi:hypothetical protein